MSFVRRFLAATTLLVLSACSQPTDIQAPVLEPQFGSDAGTASVDHMSASVDGIYLGGQWNSRPAVIKFTRSGRIPWVKTLPRSAKVKEVTAGPDGVVYAVYSVDESGGAQSFFVSKYSQTGTALWTQPLATGVEEFGVTVAASTDSKDNLYLSASLGYGESARVELRKYWAKGTLAWQRDVYGYIDDLDVSANGFIHTVSSSNSDNQTLTRYKSDGRLLWRIPLPNVSESRRVAVDREGDIYVASNDEIFPFHLFATLTKYDARGHKLWRKNVQDAIGLRLEGLASDVHGNAFLGLTNDYGGAVDERLKEFYTYNPSGKRLVRQSFDFSTEQPLVGPVAATPTEVYLATSGVGKDGQSGLLVQLNGLTGSVTWKR